jgi:hypothetical protein
MPTIPAGFSDEAREFVIGSLSKTPAGRLTVHQMLHHPWIEGYRNRR